MAWIKKNKARRRDYAIATTARKERMKVYNTTLWRRLSEQKKRENPLCEICSMTQIIRPATDVHHLQTFTTAVSDEQRDALAYDWDNLISLCDQCHNSIHHGLLKGCRSREEIKERIKKTGQ